MHKGECLIKHVKTKDGSSTRSLDYLTMELPAQGISDGMYTYKHRCEGGIDIHEIVVKKSSFRILLYYIGTLCLLVTVCRTLLSKEGLYLSSLWSISFAGIIAKCLWCDPVKKGWATRVIGHHADFWGSIRATLLEWKSSSEICSHRQDSKTGTERVCDPCHMLLELGTAST